MLPIAPGDFLNQLTSAFSLLGYIVPIVVPIIIFVTLYKKFVGYKQTMFWIKEGEVLIELKIPKDVLKSPAAMEVILASFHQTGGEGTWYDRIIKGQTRPWFSLEIVSIGGHVHFYIWMRPKFRKLIENQFYAQYPGIEILEVPDYAKHLHYDAEKYGLHGCEWVKTKKNAYPIKTYESYGLSANPKVESSIDPITPLVEFLGSLKQGNSVMIQLIVRAHKKEDIKRYKPKEIWEKLQLTELVDNYAEEAKAEIEELRDRDKGKEEKDKRKLSKWEEETVRALEANQAKLAFDCCLRTIYLYEKDAFDASNIGGMMGSLKQFNSVHMNGLKPSGWMTIFDYPWQDRGDKKKEAMKPQIIDEYKNRSFFFSGYLGSPFYSDGFIMTTEEVATIFHPPTASTTSTGLERIITRKIEAPSNLPI